LRTSEWKAEPSPSSRELTRNIWRKWSARRGRVPAYGVRGLKNAHLDSRD
jgi:hypothetical protein